MAQLFAKLAVAFGTQADKKDGEPLLEAARVHSNESTQFPFGKAWLGMVGLHCYIEPTLRIVAFSDSLLHPCHVESPI